MNLSPSYVWKNYQTDDREDQFKITCSLVMLFLYFKKENYLTETITDREDAVISFTEHKIIRKE